jgi:hypothetical protein
MAAPKPAVPQFGLNPVTAGQNTSTAGAATAVKLQYAPLVEVALAANAINLVDAAAYGHRVKLEVPLTGATGLQDVFEWNRTSGDFYPIGSADADKLESALLAVVGTNGFTDLDAQSKGLNFSSSALDDAADARYRATAGVNGANDLVMAYVLFKLYGQTTYPTIDNVFNLEDAQGMLSTADLVTAIKTSVAAHPEDIKQMFKDLIAADPQRFFEANGKQVTGIFETNADATSSGSWKLTAGDVIEIRVEFEFAEAITRRNAAADQVSTSASPLDVTSVNIASGHKFAIRLQLTATA